MKSWIYRLPKEKLAAIATVYGIEHAGTLDELRRKMSQYVDDHPEEFANDGGEPSEASAPPHIIITRAPPTEEITETILDPTGTDSRIINQIRKWGCHFDGRDPAAFLERLNELRDGYGFSGTQLLRGLPELLKGDALLWYRNFRVGWRNWEDFEDAFRLQYFPRRYAASLRREITNRYQKPGEKFAQYSTVMMTLMRRAGGFSPEEQLEQIYEHMNPEYKVYVRVDDVISIAELQIRATEFEGIEQERNEARKREKSAANPVVASVYNRNDCCWRCKQRGHTRFQCKRPAKKFCSQCGRDGVLTNECHPPAGKATGAGTTTAAITTPSPA